MKQIVCVICAVFFWIIPSGAANQLVVGYGTHYTPPYAFINKTSKKLEAGIVKDFSAELGKCLKIDVVHKEFSRKRLKTFLLDGTVHMSVRSNPQWINHPDFLWSKSWREETDVFVTRSDDLLNIQNMKDVFGKNVGTITGYVYPKLDPLFESKVMNRKNVTTVEQNFQKLKNKRIDVLVDAMVQIKYEMKHYLRGTFRINSFELNHYPVMVLISPKAHVSVDAVNSCIGQMKAEGIIDHILKVYDYDVPLVPNTSKLLY